MKAKLKLSMLLLIYSLSLSCSSSSNDTMKSSATTLLHAENGIYTDVSQAHLPLHDLENSSMDSKPADIDNDGDIDIVIASEFSENILLINDGNGHFTNESANRIPQHKHDSEDIAIADFDKDGDLDIIIVSEDDEINEYYQNDGKGYFTDVGNLIPVTGTSNAVLATDIDGDGDIDILIGNAGQNVVLINDGSGKFTEETGKYFPTHDDITQDLELGDIDNDGDLDLVVGNEDDNRILINNGSGVYSDESSARLPLPDGIEETREADLGDIDNDGDLDLIFANIAPKEGTNPQNRLLLNDGNGYFSDVTSDRFPKDEWWAMDGDFFDFDRDNDLDILFANVHGGNFQVYLNDGKGYFTNQTSSFFSTALIADGFDMETADFNGDNITDFFLSNYAGSDFLFFAKQ